jgi:hypothetical protein
VAELRQVKSSRAWIRCATKILLEREEGRVRRESVRELVAAVRPRYGRAGRAERGRMLDEFCAVTGYHRVHARRLLGGAAPAEPAAAARRGRPPTCGAAEVGLLVACWEVADRICSKRLAPYLGELLARLAACGALPAEATPEAVARVAALSPRTADRLLAPHRQAWPRRGLATTKPGTLLRQQVPIRTFAQWDDAAAGFLEVDLVAHCGTSGAGEFLFTVCGVDVATGWVALQAVRNKGELAVFEALGRLRATLPFALRGLDCDNGGEFINHNLLAYCAREGITLTRSRPYRKNDSCHVEQKNWSVVRRLAGYARFEAAALPRLDRLYALAGDYVNFCQPVLKLADRVRDGARVTKRFDTARTPYRRLLADGALAPDAAAGLAERYAALHPVRLKLAIEEAQRALYARAVREHPLVAQRIPVENMH